VTGKTILIVEDDGLIALNLAETLEKSGYLVTGPAHSGEMVLGMLEKSPAPDLILMDIGLSGSLDGIETARQIRRQYRIPLIFLTAYTSQATLLRMREIEPEGYIVKPFIDWQLLECIRNILARKAV
jgi:CheY-like chemotaxis protein